MVLFLINMCNVYHWWDMPRLYWNVPLHGQWLYFPKSSKPNSVPNTTVLSTLCSLSNSVHHLWKFILISNHTTIHFQGGEERTLSLLCLWPQLHKLGRDSTENKLLYLKKSKNQHLMLLETCELLVCLLCICLSLVNFWFWWMGDLSAHWRIY